MKHSHLALCAALLLWLAMPALAQSPDETASLSEQVGNALRQQRVFPQEKAYLHFDNNLAGQGVPPRLRSIFRYFDISLSRHLVISTSR